VCNMIHRSEEQANALGHIVTCWN